MEFKKEIDNIDIENYRAIEKLSFSTKKINIIVGRNNTGKTSLMDAIYLGLLNINSFENIRKKDFNFPLNNLIYKNRKQAKILLGINHENRKMTFETIIDFKKHIPKDREFRSFLYREREEILEDELNKIKEKMKSLDIPVNKRMLFEEDYDLRKAEIINDIEISFDESYSNTLFFTLLMNKNPISKYVYNKEYKNRSFYFGLNPFQNIVIYELLHERVKFLFNMIDQRKVNPKDNFKRILNSKDIFIFLEVLKDKFPNIYDIRNIDDNVNIVLLDNDNEKILIPLELMGDGFKSLLYSYTLFYIFSEGILLFEEPEISLHPGYMEILAELILSNINNYQFFFTTHSLDFIEAIIKIAKKEDKLKFIQIIRLTNKNAVVDREILNENEILDELEEIKIDLRGY
ncbi:MAG: ATP-binding protein [Candidatus Lokiarchaeota archaeon]|nr:ATP-binding protein [Candidatus Lokiarchaeota archaeon]